MEKPCSVLLSICSRTAKWLPSYCYYHIHSLTMLRNLLYFRIRYYHHLRLARKSRRTAVTLSLLPTMPPHFFLFKSLLLAVKVWEITKTIHMSLQKVIPNIWIMIHYLFSLFQSTGIYRPSNTEVKTLSLTTRLRTPQREADQ